MILKIIKWIKYQRFLRNPSQSIGQWYYDPQDHEIDNLTRISKKSKSFHKDNGKIYAYDTQDHEIDEESQLFSEVTSDNDHLQEDEEPVHTKSTLLFRDYKISKKKNNFDNGDDDLESLHQFRDVSDMSTVVLPCWQRSKW